MRVSNGETIEIVNVQQDTVTVSDASLKVYGICNEVFLENNAFAEIFGMVNSLYVDKTSKAIIYGMVNYAVNNGEFEIYGIVARLKDLDSKAVVHKNAIVNRENF